MKQCTETAYLSATMDTLVFHHSVCIFLLQKHFFGSFPDTSIGKESAYSAEDPGLIPGSGKSPEEGNVKSLQYSCLGNPMDRGVWRATVHGVSRDGHDSVTKPPPPPPQKYWCGGIRPAFLQQTCSWPVRVVEISSQS